MDRYVREHVPVALKPKEFSPAAVCEFGIYVFFGAKIQFMHQNSNYLVLIPTFVPLNTHSALVFLTSYRRDL